MEFRDLAIGQQFQYAGQTYIRTNHSLATDAAGEEVYFPNAEQVAAAPVDLGPNPGQPTSAVVEQPTLPVTSEPHDPA